MARTPLNTLQTKKALLAALEKSLGIVTTACKAVGIQRENHYAWMRNDPKYAAAVESLADLTIDFAESQLHKQIQSGEVAATIFYLKCKGKKRGYVERQEITGAEGKDIIPTIVISPFQKD